MVVKQRMNILKSYVRALQASAALLIVAGCQANQLPTPAGQRAALPDGRFSAGASGAPLSVIEPSKARAVRRPGSPLPDWLKVAPASAGHAFVFVSQFNLTFVNEYAKYNKMNAPPICQTTGQPYVNGIGVDTSRNLWVPQGGQLSGVTTEFAPNCGRAILQIQDKDGQPAAVSFDSKKDVYILNILGPNVFPGNIDVYTPGATKPTRVLRDNNALEPFDEVIDAHDNLYMVYNDPTTNKGHVIEFARGHNPSSPLPMTLGFPGGLAIDAADNLLVIDQDAVNVAVYAPPYTNPAIATFRLQADSIPCRFDRSGKRLYCSDFTNGTVDVYAYDASHPGATTYAYSFNNGIQPGSANAGVALSPAPPN
jgi:hypothetical protein